MNNSLLQNIEIQEQNESILQVIDKAIPNNPDIVKELSKYTRSKDRFISQLQNQWYGRPLPNYTELQVRQVNSSHYSERQHNHLVDNIQGRNTIQMDSKSWVVKSSTRWSGWSAEENRYNETPSLFEGDLDFLKNFQPLIVSDSASGSVNLIATLIKLVDKGSQMMLSDLNWSTLFLSFAKKHMPDDFQSLSQYSQDVNTLFEELVASVNADSEIAKIST